MEDSTKCANSIFEQPWWLNVVAKNHWGVITSEENGQIVARWPYFWANNLISKRVTMPKLTQTLGIWFNPDIGSGVDKLSTQKRIISDLLDKIPYSNNLKITLDSNVTYFLPFYWRGYRVKPLISYKIKKLENLELIYSNFDKTAKKNIRSAEKKVTIRYDLDIKNLTDIIDLTFKAQGRKSPNSSKLILEIFEACKKHNAGKLIAAVDIEGNVHACSLFVYDENKFYYLISGSNPQFRTSGAQSLILWEAIKFASTVSKEFDFEGSMIEGIEKFFRQFGGQPTVYFQISKLPFHMEIFELLKPRIKKILGYK